MNALQAIRAAIAEDPSRILLVVVPVLVTAGAVLLYLGCYLQDRRWRLEKE